MENVSQIPYAMPKLREEALMFNANHASGGKLEKHTGAEWKKC
jgi:hypothetical protein